MISKEHPIKVLKQALEYEEKRLAECQECIKSLKERTVKDENLVVEILAGIEGLRDAIHKLKGLDNLEKKNKVADSVEMMEHQFLRKGLYRTQLKWKDVEDMEIRKFIREYILPEMIVLLKENEGLNIK